MANLLTIYTRVYSSITPRVGSLCIVLAEVNSIPLFFNSQLRFISFLYLWIWKCCPFPTLHPPMSTLFNGGNKKIQPWVIKSVFITTRKCTLIAISIFLLFETPNLSNQFNLFQILHCFTVHVYPSIICLSAALLSCLYVTDGNSHNPAELICSRPIRSSNSIIWWESCGQSSL